jgi:aspartyl-tRNA(Asn)/glutamyl-tRNA(Gln) amidotransferase subunit B
MKGESFLMRTKEDAQDYRYFPEPDLGTIVVSPERIQALKDSLPELPHHRLLRFLADYGLPFADAELLVGSPDKALLFEAGVTGGASAKAAANWILGDVSRLLGERRCELSETLLTPEKLSAMIVLIDNGKISNTAGKAVLETVMFEDKTPEQVVRELGLAQVSDEQALEEIVRTVLDQNQKAAEDFRTGKSNALGFIVGQCMKMSRGKGNPAVLRAIAERLLQ